MRERDCAFVWRVRAPAALCMRRAQSRTNGPGPRRRRPTRHRRLHPSTVYGLSPANAARGLRRHYLAAHSAAVTLADAQTLLDAAFTTGRELTRLDAAT